jgi:rhamnose utilization protein RhaD (predicted bifunctional aldolase and dehydrogenase)
VRNRWDETQAGHWTGELEACVYVSRLLGEESSLVLYGGGNTSVKVKRDDEDLLYVKGSGADLAQAEARDFTPVRLQPVQRLIDAAQLSNTELAQAVARQVLGGSVPRPSIETLLHAVLPHRFVLHTHADSILAVTNTEHGESIAAGIFGALAPRVPFRESGFDLAKAAHEVYQAHAGAETIGLVLLHHGVFSFGDSARSAYENMLELVGLAEQFLRSRGAWELGKSTDPYDWNPAEVSALRRSLSCAAGFPLVIQLQDTPELRAFARNPHAATWWDQGPATPQHAVFVKRKPLVGLGVEAYEREYRSEVARYRPETDLRTLGLDPAPRMVIDPRLGIWAASIDAEHARMTGEIFRHDVEIISRASGHDRYAGLPRAAILDAEIHYGGFEAKARARYAEHDCLLGEVALVACGTDEGPMARALASRGAEVAMAGPQTDPDATLNLNKIANSPKPALRELVRQVGGLDILVIGPGWENWLSECVELLRYAPRGGRIVLSGPHAWCATMRATIGAKEGLSVRCNERSAPDSAFVQMCLPDADTMDLA